MSLISYYNNLIEMNLASTLNNNYAVTVGFFDGIHLGHRYLIEELKKIAQTKGLKSMIITFKEHPLKVIDATFKPELLTSNSEKLEQLQSFGIDKIIELDFNKEMANLTAGEFIKQVLHEQLGVRLLLVGHDHRFGKDRKEGFMEYQKYGQQLGMDVIQAARFSTEEFKQISSSTIRKALKAGKIKKVNALLTHPYSFEGYVVDGFKVGRKIGFPTANLRLIEPDKILPGIGVYAVEIEWEQATYKGMMNIGHRPTIDNGDAISIEVHIINFDSDIYNQQLKVTFIDKIRDEKKFNSVEELIEQLKIDKEYVSTLPASK